MIIDDLTYDDIIYVLEHLHSVCSCRDACNGCHYAYNEKIAKVTRHQCALNGIPAEWNVDLLGKEGDPE